jgi:hypothetical protein
MLVIVILIIIIWWIFSVKKNKSVTAPINRNFEYVDITPLFDSCGKDFTNSSRLLKELYGPNINDKVVIFNKNDDLLYKKRWTTMNVRSCNEDNVQKNS